MTNDRKSNPTPPTTNPRELQRNPHEVKGVCLPDEAIARLAGCRDLYVDTAKSFFAEAGKIVEQIAEAIVAGNTQSMRRTAHGLKGFAGMCGAVSVADAAAALETCPEGSTSEDLGSLLTRLRGELEVARSTLRSFLS